MKARRPARTVVSFATLVTLCLIGFANAGTATAADPVIAAAGDVACSASSSNYNGGNGTVDKCRQKYTSDLLVNAGLSSVLVLGDSQYESASLSGLNNSYHPTWGRVKSITRPAAGNHEYKTAGAAGYFDYFNGVGVATGPAGDRSKGYYSFNVGTWHLIALNSTDHCTIVPCGVGSAQETWLKADLAANADKYCTLAYWHDPRFNSGHDGNADEMQPLFQALYNADADVILGGHAHDYERFAPQNPSGQLDNARGIRQFVVGTGGAFFTSVSTPKPNSQIRQNNTYGVLKLTLHPTSYDWQFVSESNKPFTDSGTGQCHGSQPPPPTDTTKPTPPGSLGATASSGQVALSWTAATDNVGVTGYKVYRGGTEIASLGTVTSYTDTTVAGSTTYSYTVRAVDAAGNLSDPSNTATVTTPATTNFTIPAEADARVEQSTATTNYATSNLRTDSGTNASADSFLRFTVSGVQGSVQNAKLRIHAYTATADGPAVYTTGNSWVENTLTWNTRPLRTSAATDDKGAIAANTWVEYNVTPFVTGNGTYSFTIAQTSSDGVDFRAREYTSNQPQLVLTTGVDTQKPTPPGNLNATAGTGQVALTWQASTDNVGVTGYRVFRGTTQIASLGASATSYTDTGLAPGPYSYTVRAIDAAQNLSDPSNTASATVPDTTKPTPPGNLQATAGTGQVALTWQASTDNVGVTGYRVFRGTAQVASLGASATSYTDTGLAAGTYSYTVRAIDAAQNLSDPSNTASATVLDTTKPTAPGNLQATAGTGQVALTWQASTDNVGVTGYRVFRGTTEIASLGASATSYTNTGLAPGSYSYTVRAIDAAQNLSDPSNTASATVPDTTKPTAPGNLQATAGTGQVALTWQASTDNVGVTGYRVFRGTTQIASLGAGATSHTDTGLAPGPYSYTVRAIDAATNLSDPSNTASATVLDTTKPTAPGNLQATAGTRQVALTWQASTDNVGVTEYRVYRGTAHIATVGSTATSYTDTGLAAGPYSYTVKAFDAAQNPSDASNTATATVPDTTKPTAPSNLEGVASSAIQVDLTWDESTDDVAVRHYKIYRNDQLIATVDPTTSYSDTVLPGTYSYVVRAEDAATNLSDPSNTATVTVTPPDLEAPTAPQNLTADAVGGGQADLAWEASSDNVAVTGYRIYRNGQPVATINPATSYSDTVAPGDYTYVVRALDAGHESAPSNEAPVTVPDTQDPTPPANLTATTVSPSQIDLAWDAASDNVAVAGYQIYRDDVLLTTINPATAYSDSVIAPATHKYEVRALDAAGNFSAFSNSDTATVTVPDTEPPLPPGNLTAVQTSTDHVDLSWDAATDNEGVTEYRVYRDGDLLATLDATTSHTDTTVVPGPHSYAVKAADGATNLSEASNTADITVIDTQRPTTPGNLSATPVGSSRIDLAWEASTDAVGVTGYEIYRDDAPLTTIGPTTTYSDTVLAPATHTYQVRALDAAGNVSAFSNSDTASVFPPDNEAPTKPGNLLASGSGNGNVALSWNASLDNVGVTRYRVYRGTVEIASLNGDTTSFTDTGRPPGNYSYTVKAEDQAGNASDPSDPASATVPDVEKPSKPGNLTATPAGAGQVNLSWQASSDNVLVTGYKVYRGTQEIASLGPVTSFSDTGRPPGSYSYTVKATDAAGNLSDASDAASATVPDSADPTAPTQLGATAVSSTRIDLSWQASTDDVGVTGYRVYRGGGQIASIGPATSYSDTTVTAGNTYSYEVRALDGAGHLSGPSNTATATTPAPTVSVTLSPEADVQVNAGAATTNYATAKLRTDGGSTPEESLLRFTVDGVAAGTIRSAKLRVHAYTATADGPGVFTTAASWSETTVNWNTRPARTSALIDDKGAIPANTWVEYDVTPFVTGSGTYSFGLAMSVSDGVDFRSREYATNQPELVVDAGPPDTQKPTAPAGLAWTAPSPTRVDLSWQASTDNVAVTSYRVYRGTTQIASVGGTTTSYSDTTVTAGSTNTYEVRAVDANNNLSDASNAVNATTPTAASVLTLSPEADARVHAASPTTNYGTSYLRANGGSEPLVESFLRFTVTGASAGVTSAKLRLYATNGTVDGPAIYTTATAWTETAINWNTRPARTSGATDDKGAIPVNSWIEYDVTPFVTGNGTYSFTLATTSADGVDFNARESATLRPELVVTLP